MAGNACTFCKIAKKEIPSKIVFEDDEVLAFEDIRPEAPVHILVIPKRHIAKVSDLDADNVRIVGALILAANNIASRKKIQESGYRIVLNCNKDAGQEAFHIHLHLLGGRPFNWPPG